MNDDKAIKMWIRLSNLKGMLFIILQPVVQQYTQRHDAAVKFAILGCPVGVNNDCRLIWENVAPFSTLTFQLLLTLTLLFLKKGKEFNRTYINWLVIQMNKYTQISIFLLYCFYLSIHTFWMKSTVMWSFTSRSSSVLQGSSSSMLAGSAFSGSLDSSTCSSTFSCFMSRAINWDFSPLELRDRFSSSFRRSFT